MNLIPLKATKSRYSQVITGLCVLQHGWLWFAFGVWQIVFYNHNCDTVNLPGFWCYSSPQTFQCPSSPSSFLFIFTSESYLSVWSEVKCFIRERDALFLERTNNSSCLLKQTTVVFYSYQTVRSHWMCGCCHLPGKSGSFSCITGSIEKKWEYPWTHDLRSTNHELNLCSHCEERLFYYGPFMLKMLCTQ